MPRKLTADFRPRLPTGAPNLLCLTALTATALLLIGCSEAPSAMPKGPSAMKVQVIRVQATSNSHARDLIGRIVARAPADILSAHEGLRVQQVFVDAGQHVKAGQVLVQLDGRQLRQERLQAEQVRQRARAQVAGSRAQQALVESKWRVAEDEAMRYREVADSGAVSEIEQRLRQSQMEQAQADRDAARESLTAAQADLAAAEAALALAKSREGDVEIRAPFDGIVSERRVEVGSVVQASAGPLFRLARADDREFEAGLDGQSAAGLSPGQTVEVLVTPTGQAARVAMSGRVRAIDTALSDSLRRGSIRIEFVGDWPSMATRPPLGSAATARLRSGPVQGLPLPPTAVQFDPEPWVYVVTPDNRVAKRRVGLAAGGNTVVSGLRAGETVVRSAGALLSPGQLIEPLASTHAVKAGARQAEAIK